MKTIVHLRLAAGFLLLSLLVLLLSACDSEEDNFIMRIFDREKQMAIGAAPATIEELTAAIREYGAVVDQTVAANEKIGTYWRLLANRYIERNLFGEAYTAAVNALKFYPDNSGLYYVAGISAAYNSLAAQADINSGEPSREAWLRVSEAAYLNSLRFNDRATTTMYSLALLYAMELDRPDEALQLLERYFQIISRNVDAWNLYARTLYIVGRLQEAVDAYDKVIDFTEIKERREQAQANKARILEEMYDL
ncbi:MAG: hypothetical protein KKI09_10090 [Spirochaetes bacterium]|nr:hypothetical protein [Spirochaetota bacterium]MBU0955766.1 hypothetical protein [Spirochaetota bacterium]